MTDLVDKKKRKKAKEPPPLYGSKEYWESRYKKLKAPGRTQENDALPYHSWYFTYTELRPLILPLILGGRDIAGKTVLEEDDAGGGEGELEIYELDDNVDEKVGLAGSSSQDCDEDEKEEEEEPEEEKGEGGDDDGEEELVVEEEVTQVSDDDDDDDEEEEEEEEEHAEAEQAREGLAKSGPIHVLEIGCGDVPLGKELAQELIELEEKTGAKATGVVERVVCCDYSAEVINILKADKLMTEDNGKNVSKTRLSDLLKYEVSDARSMKQKSGSVHLILEKGTLDAMLSDKQEGIKNCIAIVTECARVLATGGYLVIISHLNAHTNNGLQWLDDVVVTGLRAGGGKATWECEVHGNDGQNDSDDEGEGEATNKPPSGSPGPCVYIIQKMPPQEESKNGEDPPTIPLKFFVY